MITTTFNTHRLYQAEGQIITAHVQADRTVLFKDHSRMICGKINQPIDEGYHIPAFVMEHYDRLDYRMSTEAMALDRQPEVISFKH